MTQFKNMYLMRDIGGSMNALAPTDKIMLTVKGTATSGDLNVDLSEIVRPGADVMYFVFKVLATDSTTGVLAAKGEVEADSVPVEVVIIVDPKDFVMD